MPHPLDRPDRYVPLALAFSIALVVLQLAWKGAGALVWPLIAALVVNTVLSIRILLQQGRVFVGVVALNMVQLALFAALHRYIYRFEGSDHYDFYRPPGWVDWFEMVAAHALRAVDVLDVLSAYGLRMQNVISASPLSSGLVVAMLLMVDLFLFGTLLRLVHRPAPVQRLAAGYGTVMAMLKRFRLPLLGLSLVAFFFLFMGDITRDWYQANLANLFTWPLDNLLRVLDFTDAFHIFNWQLHTLPMTPVAATVAVAYRLAVGAYFIEWIDATFVRLFKGRGQTLEELGAQAADEGMPLADRLIAVAAIGRMGRYGEPVVADLTTALGGASPRLQQAAAEVLVGMGADAIGPLVQQLPCRRTEVTGRIHQVLGAIDPHWRQSPQALAAQPELMQRLMDGDARIRTCALEILDQIDGRWSSRDAAMAAVPEFINHLAHWDPAVRTAAAEALAAIGPAAGRAVFRLTRMLADGHGHARHAARQALARVDPNWRATAAAANAVPHIMGLVADGDGEQRDVAAEALATVGPVAVAPMVACLAEPFSSPRRTVAIQALSQIGPAAATALLPLLGRSDPRVVAGATQILAAVRPPETGRLIQLLGQPAQPPADMAASVLKTIGVQTLPELIAALKPNQPLMRRRLLNLLGAFGPAARNALPLIQALANDPDLADAATAAMARIAQSPTGRTRAPTKSSGPAG
jgi:HEAT repeat protein